MQKAGFLMTRLISGTVKNVHAKVLLKVDSLMTWLITFPGTESSPSRQNDGSVEPAGEGQGPLGSPHPQPEGSRKRYRSYSGHTPSSPKKQAPLQTDMGRSILNCCCFQLYVCLFQNRIFKL